MLKQTKLITVKIDDIKQDRIFQRIWYNSGSQTHFTAAVDKFKHHTNPVAYEKDGKYYLLGHKSSLDAVIELGQDNVQLEIISLEATDITQFLILFLSQEHKELKCTAELVKVILEYINSQEGKEWFETVNNSQDKEVRIATILGISCHAVKCYLKLVQPGNEMYLNMLKETEKCSLSKAYNECISAEKGSRNAAKLPVDHMQQQNGHVIDDRSIDDITDEDDFFSETSDQKDVHINAIRERAQDNFQRHLDKYKKSHQELNEENGMPSINKVVVMLNDGINLEFDGKIVLFFNGNKVVSTEPFLKMPNGSLSLPKKGGNISLSIDVEYEASSNLIAA